MDLPLYNILNKRNQYEDDRDEIKGIRSTSEWEMDGVRFC